MSSSFIGPSLGFLPAPYLPRGRRVCALVPGQALDWWDRTGGRHDPWMIFDTTPATFII